MKISNRQKGQTLIETAIILVLLLLIVFGITEFSRAWFTKNSLKNAARTGARIAVVTAGSTNTVCPVNSTTGQIRCDSSRTFTSCPGSGIINSICVSPGLSLQDNPAVSICYLDGGEGTPGTLDGSDTVNVCARMGFRKVVPKLLDKFIPSQFFADASMRYE